MQKNQSARDCANAVRKLHNVCTEANLVYTEANSVETFAEKIAFNVTAKKIYVSIFS